MLPASRRACTLKYWASLFQSCISLLLCEQHATAVAGLRLFVHGGYAGGKWLDDLHVLDTQALTWTQWTPSGSHPSGRSGHTLNNVDDKLYLFGEWDDTKKMKWDQLIQPIGKGTFDMSRLVRILRNINYRGEVGFQAYRIPGDDRENLKQSITAWNRLIAR